jgi:hypothetical protein
MRRYQEFRAWQLAELNSKVFEMTSKGARLSTTSSSETTSATRPIQLYEISLRDLVGSHLETSYTSRSRKGLAVGNKK